MRGRTTPRVEHFLDDGKRAVFPIGAFDPRRHQDLRIFCWRVGDEQKVDQDVGHEQHPHAEHQTQQAIFSSVKVPAGTGLVEKVMVCTSPTPVEITCVEWGGDVVNAMKQIEAKQDKVKVNWVLHQGGSGAILPKIKASWPKPQVSVIAVSSPIAACQRSPST